jgi:hypothetical protein
MSLPGGDTIPYRNPCEGTALCWLGSKWQNAKANDANIALYELSLQIPNWDGFPSGSPADIFPFEKPATVSLAPDSCESGFCAAQFGGTSPPCESWIGGDEQQYTLVASQINTAPAETFTQPTTISKVTIANGGTGYHVGDSLLIPGGTLTNENIAGTATVQSVNGTGVITEVTVGIGGLYFTNPSNTVTPTGGSGSGASLNLTFKNATVNLAVCQKTGWKGVQARRYWHGRFPFVNSEGCPNMLSSCDDTTVAYEAYEELPFQTKYLNENRASTMTYSINYNTTNTTDPSTGDQLSITSTLTWSYDISQTISVNPLSGVKELTLVSNQTGEGNWTCDIYDITSGEPYGSYSGLCAVYGSGDGTYVGPVVDTTPFNCAPTTGDSTFGGQVSSQMFTWENIIFGFDACGGWVTAGIPTFLSDALDYPIRTSADLVAAINSYEASVNALAAESGHAGSIGGTATFTDTSLTFGVMGSFSLTAPNESYQSYNESLTMDGSITISGTNTPTTVYDDVVALLEEFDLTDDTLYPWRTEGFQGSSPLISRLEYGPSNPDFIYLTEGVPFPTDWYDMSGYALSGETLVLLYDGSIQGIPNPAGYQDYFRFDWLDWKVCLFNDGSDPIVWDFYQYGYGMSLIEYINNSGIQLPKNATNWVNNYQAINKPPYAWLLYADQTQVMNGDYGTGANDNIAIWAGKYAEIKESWPSMNAARPAGEDKFDYDETQVYGLTNISGSGPGSTWTLVDYAGNTPASLTMAGDWGGKVVEGFYSGCTYSSGTVTLGTLAYNLPSNWTSESGDDSICFGALRWPTAPSLLGRNIVSVDGTGMNFTFGNGQPNFGMLVSGHEQIDLYDRGMNLIASNITAQRIVTKWAAATNYTMGQMILDSNGNVQIVQTGGTSGATQPTWGMGSTNDNGIVWDYVNSADLFFTTSAPYPTAIWVMIHGAAAYYFDDQYQKGDFVTLQTGNDYRTNGEYARLTGILDCTGTQVTRPTENEGFTSFSQTAHCLPFQQCNPRVICFSPNGENFSNGITIPFPTSFVFDERYGSRWQGVIQQVMDDPLWQTPHRPIGRKASDDSPIAWEMANLCDADTEDIAYFQHVPQLEAIIALPSNYGPSKDLTPPDPFSVYENLAWYNPVTNASGPGVYEPPIYCGFQTDGYPAAITTSGILHAEFVAAIAAGSGCRFNYDNDVIL